jgi:trehalose 6-phosphate synthase/phosphatase
MAEQQQQKQPPKWTGHLAPIHEAGTTSLSPAVTLTNQAAEGNSDPGSPNLPPHERSAVTRVPVTPDIRQDTYQTPALQRTQDSESAGYFTLDPRKHDRPAKSSQIGQSAGDDFGDRRSSSPTNLIRGAMTGEEVLRRMSHAAAGRRESITDIRSAAPDLALTGNIISVTFTTPHTIRYHKNGGWVCQNQIPVHLSDKLKWNRN